MLKKLILCILCFAASHWSGNALSEIYRWVDAEGNIQYGDKPVQVDQAEDISEQVEDRNVVTSEIGKNTLSPV